MPEAAAVKINSSLDSNGIQFAWDATSISLAETCLRKYKYTIIDRFAPRRKSVHLLFGGWYAEAIEHYHKYVAEGATKDEALIRVVREALIDTWVYEDEDGNKLSKGMPWQSDEPTKTRETLIRSIIWYFAHYEDDPTEVVTLANGKPAVELSFSIEVDDDILFCGHLDRLCTFGDDPYVMDQKTTKSTLSPLYFRQYSPHTQMSGYAFAGKIAYNLPVKGVIIDAAQIAVGFTRFERDFTFRTEEQLEEWYNDSMYHIRLARAATQADNFPMNRTSCSDYGGCEFREVCSLSPSNRASALKADFIKREPWDPLERR